MEAIAAQVGIALKSHGVWLATAESCTGGAVAAAVTDIAGSSAWFERGFVTYANAAKVEMLGVSPETLAANGAVSEAVVREMVQGALRHSRAHVALAITGVAGPAGGSLEKPVGTVWFAWCIAEQRCVTCLRQLTGSRADIREQSVRIALQGVLALLADRNCLA